MLDRIAQLSILSLKLEGSLTPGKRADYVLLSKDILTIPAPEILTTQVIATVLDGRVAFGQV